jgi:tetratricopeptide (TPR) repeat protein
MNLSALTVEQILNEPFPSYHKPLELARVWNRSGHEEERRKAKELLVGLRARYPLVLAIGQEYALALEEALEADRAEEVLKSLEKTFPNLDEELLCRWGRLFKDRGDAYVRLPWSKQDGQPPDPDLAGQFYRKALEKYEQAYHLRTGHYPGINTATLWLLLGSLKSQASGSIPSEEVGKAQERAGELLKNRSRWPNEQPDDETVWHPATAGEAHLLRQEWQEAVNQYREALKGKNLTSLARNSMSRQVDRILMCYRNLGVPIPPLLDDLHALFATRSPAPVDATASAGAPSDGPDPGSRL